MLEIDIFIVGWVDKSYDYRTHVTCEGEYVDSCLVTQSLIDQLFTKQNMSCISNYKYCAFTSFSKTFILI